MKQRIPVRQVRPGMFSTERYVEFEVNGRGYSLFVDQQSVRSDNTLEVRVVESNDDKALIELPRATFTGRSRLTVPKNVLQPA